MPDLALAQARPLAALRRLKSAATSLCRDVIGPRDWITIIMVVILGAWVVLLLGTET